MKIRPSSSIIDKSTNQPLEIEAVDIALPRYINKEGYEEVETTSSSIFYGDQNLSVTSISDAVSNTIDASINDTSKFQKINSKVGNQDNGPLSVGKIIGNNLANAIGLSGISDAIENLRNTYSADSSEENELTNSMLKLSDWKSKRYKELQTNNWRARTTLNPTHNSANSAFNDYRGELGKTTGGLAGLAENSWAKATLSAVDTLFGTTSLSNTIINATSDKGDKDWATTADELLVLNSVTKDTIYTSKPGTTFKAKEEIANGILQNIMPVEKFRENEIAKTKAVPRERRIRNFVLNNSNAFSKKQRIYEIKENNASYGDTYNLEQNNNGGLIWNLSDELFSNFNLSEEEARLVTFLKNRNTFNKSLGYIYIRPYYDYKIEGGEKTNNGFGVFDIPFEFTPRISESATQANYQQETLLGRLGQFNVFTGTNLPSLSIELDYLALAPDNLDQEDTASMGKQHGTDAWQYFWTNNRIEAIEYKLRSLVFADYVSGDYLIKPPLVEIHLENNLGEGASVVGDLYKYPNAIETNDQGARMIDGLSGEYMAFSAALEKTGNYSRYKKYIVTSVQIDKINDADILYPSLYGRKYNPANYQYNNTMYHINQGENSKGWSGHSRKLGFKATLQLQEVTENFLDLVPDFKAYYDAWNYKEGAANRLEQFTAASLGVGTGNNLGEMMSVEDILTSSYNTIRAGLLSAEDKKKALFQEAENLAKLWAKSNATKNKTQGGVPSYFIGFFNSSEDTFGSGKEVVKNPFRFLNTNLKLHHASEKVPITNVEVSNLIEKTVLDLEIVINEDAEEDTSLFGDTIPNFRENVTT